MSPFQRESRGSYSWGSQSGLGDKEQRCRDPVFFLHCLETVNWLMLGSLFGSGLVVESIVFCGLHCDFLSVIQKEGRRTVRGGLHRKHHKVKHQDVTSIKLKDNRCRV